MPAPPPRQYVTEPGALVDLPIPAVLRPLSASTEGLGLAPERAPLPDHDNHHNALLCPYCNPARLVLTAPRKPLTLHQREFIRFGLNRRNYPVNEEDFAEYVRLIECAHGIEA